MNSYRHANINRKLRSAKESVVTMDELVMVIHLLNIVRLPKTIHMRIIIQVDFRIHKCPFLFDVIPVRIEVFVANTEHIAPINLNRIILVNRVKWWLFWIPRIRITTLI